MEQQILICNEPSPTSPTTTNTTKTPNATKTLSSHNSFVEHHLLLNDDSNNETIYLNNSRRKNIEIKNNHSFDSSPTTSDSSGYDSNTSIISSIHSIDDDSHQPLPSSSKEFQQFFSHKRPRSDENDLYDDFYFEEEIKNSVDIINGSIDYHLLDDNNRILKQMLQIEQHYIPWMVDKKVYNCSKYDTNEKIRHELTEWMFEVCEAFNCEEGIFTLSVNYLDRFMLSMPSLPKSQLQLVGTVCMLIASKIHQCNSLDTNYLSYATENTFTVKEILIWEQIVLKHLNWDVSPVVANDYLDYILVIFSKLLTSTKQSCCQSNDDVNTNKKYQDFSINNGNQNKKNRCYRKRSKIYHNHKRFNQQKQQKLHNQNSMDDVDDHNHYNLQSRVDDGHKDSLLSQSSLSSTISTIRRHTNTFITICSTELSFVCVKPSVIATACVAAAIRGLVGHHHPHHHHHQQQQSEQLTKSRQIASNNQVNHQPESMTNTATMEVSSEIYERFLINIKQQMDIDVNLIETYAQQIENLAVSKASVSIDLSTSSSSTISTNNETVSVKSSIISTTITTIEDFPPEHSKNNNKSSRNKKCSHEHPIIQQPYNNILRNSTMVAKTPNITTTSQYHHYNHHHSNQQCHPPQQSQSQTYIHTTFAQVASAKQLLLLNQQQQQQTISHQQVSNRFYNTACGNIPSRISLIDTTNNNINNINLNNNNDANNEDGGSVKPQTSILADLLAYLEQEDRENIPLLIIDPPAPISNCTNIMLENQENVPPQSSSAQIDENNDVDINDDDDEGLEEDLYF